jgi:hypothetical protein
MSTQLFVLIPDFMEVTVKWFNVEPQKKYHGKYN